jgi:hypothetical protein
MRITVSVGIKSEAESYKCDGLSEEEYQMHRSGSSKVHSHDVMGIVGRAQVVNESVPAPQSTDKLMLKSATRRAVDYTARIGIR